MKPRALSLRDDIADAIVDGEDLSSAANALFQRLRRRFVEEVVDASKHRLIRSPAQSRSIFVRRPQGQKRRLIELECEGPLVAVLAGVCQRAQHADRLERLLLEVVRLLGIQRQDLERDLAIRHEQRDDRARAQGAQRLQSMIAIRRPVFVVLANGDDGIEKPAERLDDVHQTLDVRLRRVALKWCGLDPIDRQRGEQHRRPAERVAIRRQNGAAVALNLTHQGLEGGAIDNPCLRRRKPNRFRSGLLPTFDGPLLGHGAPILAPSQARRTSHVARRTSHVRHVARPARRTSRT